MKLKCFIWDRAKSLFEDTLKHYALASIAVN